MKVILYIFFISFLAYAESSPKRVEVDTLLEVDGKKGDGVGLDFIDGVQRLLDRVKNAITTKALRKNTNERLKFTDFVENAVIILKTYRDEDLQKVFDILDEEIHKYHYEGCKIHELTEKHAIRRFISNKLDEVKKTSPKKIRRGLDGILKTLQERKYDGKQAKLIKYINSIYGIESTLKLATILYNLQQYQAKTRKTYLDLVSIVKTGIRSVIFDHYSNLSKNVRKELKLKLESYWTDNMNHKINHQVIQFGGDTLKTADSFEFTSPKIHIVRFIPNISPIEEQVTKKERKRKRKERHRPNKDKLTTEGIYESFLTDENVDYGRIMTLFPEPIKLKKKYNTATTAFKTHADSRDSPHPLYRSVIKRHGKKHKKRQGSKVERSTKKLKLSEQILRSPYTVERHGDRDIVNENNSSKVERSTKKHKHSKTILKSLYTVERNSDRDTVNENTEGVKSAKHKNKNREAKTHKHEKRKKEKAVDIEEISSKSNEDEPRLKYTEKNVLQSKKRVTKKSMSEDTTKVTADDIADTSSSEQYPKTMRFRNMDAESNEGMSIEEFEPTPRFFYRKSNSNASFVDIEAKKKKIQADNLDKRLIKRLDNLEKQLQAVKIKIAIQGDHYPKFVTDKVKYNITSNISESSESTSSESDDSPKTNTDTINISLPTKSRITKDKTSTSSVTTTNPLVKVTASSSSATVKLTKVTEDATTATVTKVDVLNETRKEKPRVIMKRTSDYFVIPNYENLLNTTVPSHQNVNKNVSNKNLRKTGLTLDESVDNFVNNNSKTTALPFLTKLELEKALFNESTMVHDDKEKDLLINKTVDEDLKKIYEEMHDGKMDLQMPNSDINVDNNTINRRNMNSVFGQDLGYSHMPSFDINNWKDTFSGDLEGI